MSGFPPRPMAMTASGRIPITTWLRREQRVRALRERYFGRGLFADPVWEILLELEASHLDGRRMDVSSVCIASRIAPATAGRVIHWLDRFGIVERRRSLWDRRRTFIDLTPAARSTMRMYLAAIDQIDPASDDSPPSFSPAETAISNIFETVLA